MVSVGVGPTPLLYFAAHHLGTDGAMMITASHNPAPDNGFKLMRGKASFFGADIQALADLLEQDAASTELTGDARRLLKRWISPPRTSRRQALEPRRAH